MTRSRPGSVTPPTVGLGGELTARKQRSLWSDAWRRLRRNKLAVIGLVIVVTFSLIALFAPLIAPYGQAEVVDFRLAQLSRPPGPGRWGLTPTAATCSVGCSMARKCRWSSAFWRRRSCSLIGVPSALFAGYFGGATDNVLMRLVDVIYAIPQLLMVLLFVNWWGPGCSISSSRSVWSDGSPKHGWCAGNFCRCGSRSTSARRRSRGRRAHIIRKHMLPNSLTPIIVALTFGIPTAIFTEAALSFVGVGIRPPQASWGQMVAEGSNPGYISPIRTCSLPGPGDRADDAGFTFLGDGLRDALDPKGHRGLMTTISGQMCASRNAGRAELCRRRQSSRPISARLNSEAKGGQ